jgi:hypothetical protein
LEDTRIQQLTSRILHNLIFKMGNGAKAQQKRERAADKTKKGPTSQLKSVRLAFPRMRLAFR